MPPELTSTRPLRIWALLGARRGGNNQVIALAEALGLPYETKTLIYNDWRRLYPRVLGTSLRSLAPESRPLIAGEPPDVTLSIGHRSVPVVRAIKARSNGRTRAIHLGNPRASPRHFDLVITTPQYPVPDAPNVVRLPLALGRPSQTPPKTEKTARFFDALTHPRRLLLLGGPTRYWTITANTVAHAIAALRRQAEADGGSLAVVGSPRTPKQALRAALRAIGGARAPMAVVPIEGPPSYAELLAAADEIFVTSDSVSMMSEALRTGKPVGLVPIEHTRIGAVWLWLMDRIRPGRPVYPRDLRYFWAQLDRQGLAGTLDRPVSGAVPDVVTLAAAEVRRLLGLPVRPAIAVLDVVRSRPASQA